MIAKPENVMLSSNTPKNKKQRLTRESIVKETERRLEELIKKPPYPESASG